MLSGFVKPLLILASWLASWKAIARSLYIEDLATSEFVTYRNDDSMEPRDFSSVRTARIIRALQQLRESRGVMLVMVHTSRFGAIGSHPFLA